MGVYAAFVVLLASGCVLAAWRGGSSERQVAAVMVLAFCATQLGRFPIEQRYVSVNTFTVAIDVLMLTTLGWIMIRSARRWPIAIVSLQCVLVLSHLVRASDQKYIALTYAIMTMTWPFMQVALLFYGTATARHRSPRI